MGLGRTGDRAVGLVAVIRGAGLLALVLLAGCSSTPPIVAAVTGGVAGGATANPAIGFAVAVATDAAASEIVRYYGRSRQNSEQNAIADVAGELPIGTEASWRIEHTIPIGDEHGVLRVVRQIDNPLAVCREIVFSVDEGKGATLRRAWYDADICHQADRWKWASAEPAVARWGYLQ